MKTEIHLNEEFGHTIYQTVLKYRLKNNLEIGSWDGEGSTRCFVEAMKLLAGPKHLQCIEIVEEKYNVLKQRYADVDFVECFHGSSIVLSDLIYRSFDDVWNSPYNKINKSQYSKETVKEWFDRDIQTMSHSRSFLYARSPKVYDSVLIDGSEFTGYSEYHLLKDKVKVFFLGDVHRAFKCYQIYYELKMNPNWTLLAEFPDIRNGGAIFYRKN